MWANNKRTSKKIDNIIIAHLIKYNFKLLKLIIVIILISEQNESFIDGVQTLEV